MKKIFRASSLIAFGTFVAPLLACAQSGINTTYIKGYADSITNVINHILLPVLIALAFIVFLWGVYQYFIQGAASDEARKTGRTFVLYGVIGFVVLFSIWGIVQIFMGTLGLSAGNVPIIPTFNPPGSTSNANTTSGVNASSQASNSLIQARDAYNNCVALRGAPNCTQQSNTLGQAQSAYNAILGRTTSGGYPVSANTDGSCPSGYSPSSEPSTGYCIPNSASSNTGGYIAGCTSSSASNYNPNANFDDGSCTGSSTGGYIAGCTDSTASNYNSNANFDDGSCVPYTDDAGGYGFQ